MGVVLALVAHVISAWNAPCTADGPERPSSLFVCPTATRARMHVNVDQDCVDGTIIPTQGDALWCRHESVVGANCHNAPRYQHFLRVGAPRTASRMLRNACCFPRFRSLWFTH